MKLKLQFGLVSLSCLIFSCQSMKSTPFKDEQKPVLSRLPDSSEAANLSKYKNCGQIISSESSYTTVDSDDLGYALVVDCNQNQKIDDNEFKKVIWISNDSLVTQQKSWITRWRKRAITKNKNVKAQPYVCMTYSAKKNVCDMTTTHFQSRSQNRVEGFLPHFTSHVKF